MADRPSMTGKPTRVFILDDHELVRRGLQGMVTDDKYCIDILTQVSAMTSALQSVALGLLDDHLNHCVRHAAEAGGPEADAKIKEASAAIARLVRS